jgi:NAD(P)-dependent dehydrogenase (short-subunit alcohol dehydrogenase family)
MATERTAIISGGGSGVGRAAALRLAGDGWRVAVLVRATLTPRPSRRSWSMRTMAHAQGVSEKSIRNIWHQ